MVVKSNLNGTQKEYIPGKENAFADFLSQKYDIDQPSNDKPSTSNQTKTIDIVNVVETRAKSRQKLAPPPQNDLEVPEMPNEEKIVDPTKLPNQDQWPFTQQQIADAQKVDPMLDQTQQKVENQLFSTGMQSRAGTSCGSMCCKQSYVDPILPTHNCMAQIHKMSTLLEYILIESELLSSCISIAVWRQRSTVWSRPFIHLSG
uniref:Uncharacterized protein n=1 Tax=Romanomermis culicivorax TaxID=13658 RepID=A0A915IJB9_ROMCU